MVASGEVHLRDYKKLEQARQLYKLKTEKLDSRSTLDNYWYWGPSGSGKSKKARDDDPDAFIKMPNKWWDGYENEATVLLDDIGLEHKCLGYHFKIWADHYPFAAETKGATVKIRPSKIVVTSNYHPRDIWDDPAVL